MRNKSRFMQRLAGFVLAVAALAAAAVPAAAQPFGAWLTLAGNPTHGYVQIPHSAALNPTGALTIEAWVAIRDAAGCSSIIGKDYLEAYWIGICGTTLRAYLKGGSSAKNGGTVPVDKWTHIAVTFDGATQRHYINGELIQSFPLAGPLTTSSDPVRIGSDVSWQFTPDGSIDEVRIWNVARTQAQIRSTINVRINAAEPGLVSVWGLNGNANDAVGGRNGATGGSGVGFLTFPVALNCGSNTATALCLDDRFLVTAEWRTSPASSGPGRTVSCASDDSGLFWFFAPENWEVMVKVVNGCGLNNRYWVFSAATTNVFYRLEVLDVQAGAQKIYFNYPGPPAPAVTDTSAFATCP